MEVDVWSHNSRAWDAEVGRGNRWTLPVSPEEVAQARQGLVRIVLTPTKIVPSTWLGRLDGTRILCLASGGGQQAPLLAAAGSKVTVFDASPKQLDRDREVAVRESLPLDIVRGDMADLSRFGDETFDLIVHPVSNSFVPDVGPVWREAHRVLRPGGHLLAGFMNPIVFCFDEQKYNQGILELRHSLPYSDLTVRSAAELADFAAQGQPLEFGHSLEDQIGGQVAAGFAIIGFYEDTMNGSPCDPLFPTCIATRAVKG